MKPDEASEADLDRIRTWSGDWPGLLAFMESIWPEYGAVHHKRGRRWHFATGGWSGCEEIIGAFYANSLANAVLWESTSRGGRHVLKEPATKKEGRR